MMRQNGLTAVILLLVALGLTISGRVVFSKGVTIQDLGTLGGRGCKANAVKPAARSLAGLLPPMGPAMQYCGRHRNQQTECHHKRDPNTEW